jgi:hypothetical protein
MPWLSYRKGWLIKQEQRKRKKTEKSSTKRNRSNFSSSARGASWKVPGRSLNFLVRETRMAPLMRNGSVFFRQVVGLISVATILGYNFPWSSECGCLGSFTVPSRYADSRKLF